MELLLSIVRKCLERGERLAVFSHSVSTLREIEDEFRVGLKNREEFQVPASPKLVTVYVGQSFICMCTQHPRDPPTSESAPSRPLTTPPTSESAPSRPTEGLAGTTALTEMTDLRNGNGNKRRSAATVATMSECCCSA
eukprot:4254856-Pyramimonas_sp.AAC.2